ncbi:UDP-N-acetylmuramoyl-tripeptide--D-alanyl-D-alanine ligase [Candidatus Nomurabacteria bacterium]|nr:UDP-N-acetylmuramoyl-tripeptide--D-alanyl-D-alanine ligase [Candidatus Nomurabacteria bacterium]
MRTTVKTLLSYTLQTLAKAVLLKYKPKVISITGSIGKTSTKDAVYAVMSKVTHVRKSQKSYNSELGLPLTILGCPNGWNNPVVWMKNIFKGLWLIIYPQKYPKWLVLEVGIGKPGDMKKTASWLKSDVVIITGIGETPAHIEFFNSRDHLVQEKSGLIKTLKKDGVLILNADDEAALEFKNKTKNRIITYGFSRGVDILGSEDSIFYDKKNIPKGVSFRVDEGGKSLPVFIEGVFGRNHLYAALAALAISFNLKLNMLEAADALKNYDIPPGRMRLLLGISNSLLIDDTYNSSPFACSSALQTLGEIKCSGRKIAVLGDMLELGRHTVEAHKEIGKISKNNVDVLIVVGQRAKFIREGAEQVLMKKKNLFEFLNSYEAGEFLKTFIQDGDIVLIKGSQGMRMERVVSAVLLDQTHKSKLLVRQEKEWLDKK